MNLDSTLEDQRAADEVLDTSVAPAGLVQNRAKQDIMFTFWGKGAQAVERQVKGKGLQHKSVVDCMKYLGIWLQSTGGCRVEVGKDSERHGRNGACLRVSCVANWCLSEYGRLFSSA